VKPASLLLDTLSHENQPDSSFYQRGCGGVFVVSDYMIGLSEYERERARAEDEQPGK
jgi:hypothetical protein